MVEITSLWDILNKYGVEVPPIQRDYAQGRETENITKVRDKFLGALLTSLKNQKNMHLDFVYGKINGLKSEEEYRSNKKAIEYLLKSLTDYASSIDLKVPNINVEEKSSDRSDLIYFIPIDGQQRLTTLFLIHWYIAKRLKKNESLSILKRFRYKIRRSSTAFLKLLTSQETKIPFNDDLKQEIEDLEFFSSSWMNDPTVKSMLVMLKEIHLNLKDIDSSELEKYWISLTKNKLIWFDFLNLKNFKLSDELYVKMNARGKQLSSFENFKAWMLSELEKKGLIPDKKLREYHKKIDVDWNDIFWNNKLKGEYKVDHPYFNFFKLLFLYDNVKKAKLNDTNFATGTKESILIENVQNNKSFDWEYAFDDDFFANVIEYFNLLSYCAKYKAYNNKYLSNFFGFLFTSNGIKPTWKKLLNCYITLSFLQHKAKALKDYSDNDLNQIFNYQRVMFNLLDNSIIDNPKLYKNALNQIDKTNVILNNKNYNIVKWVEELNSKSLSVFSENQLLEEILKYRLFQDKEWENLILEAERVQYFERQLNFWFFNIGLPLANDGFNKSFLDDHNLKSDFKDITIKIKLLFNEYEINKSDVFKSNIFERALLSGSDYLLKEKGYKCFCQDSGRDVSWKRLFLRDRNNEETNDVLKEIFNLDFSDIKGSFDGYIKSNSAKYSKDKWRKSFIENEQLFKYLGKYRYIRKIDNHGWVLIKDHYKTYIGPHYELYSLDFYLKSIKDKTFDPFTNSDYFAAPKKNDDLMPCAYLDGWKYNDTQYAIDILYSYERNKFQLRFFYREKGVFCEVINSILKDQNFCFDEDIDSFILFLDEEKVISEVNSLCSEFKNQLL